MNQWGVQQAVVHGADRIISLTNSERELLTDYCPEVNERIRVVGNGIEDVSPPGRSRRKNREIPIVLFSGRFVDRKGIWELMKAIEIVLAATPRVQFVLAGGHRDCPGSQMEAWLLPESLYPHRSKVQFTGWLTPGQMDEWYRAADILVVPSWYEPFGMVVLEGMINGLAVAASAVGGPAEILRDRRTRTSVSSARRRSAGTVDLAIGTRRKPPEMYRQRRRCCCAENLGDGRKSSRRCAQYTRRQYRFTCRASSNGAGIRWVEIAYAQMVYLPHDTAACSFRNTIVSS